MRAVIADGGGGPEVPENWSERPVPQPGQGEILVRVHAGAINRPDVFQRLAIIRRPPGPPIFSASKFAGEVVACGEVATDFAWVTG